MNTSLVSDDSKSGVAIYGFTRERSPFDANDDGFSESAQMGNITVGTRFFHRFGFRSKLTFDLFNIREDRNGGNRQDYPLHERDIGESVKHNIKTGAVTFEQYFRDYDLFSVFLSAQHLNRDSYYGANRSLKDYGNSKNLTYSAGLQYKATIGASSVIAGIEQTGDWLLDSKLGYPDFNNANIVNDTILSVPHVDNISVSDQASSTAGIFVQYEMKINRLKLGIGGRYDHYVIKDRTTNGGIKDGNVFSPRINIMYEVVKSLQVRLSYSQGFRAPQLFDEDLHIETSGSRKVIHVNDPYLKQETSHSYMASLDFNRLIGTVSAGLLVEAFYTRLSNPFFNEIGIPDEEGVVYYTRRNAESGASVAGINTELKLKPLSEFSVTSGFTFQASRYEQEQQFNIRRFFRTPNAYGYFAMDWDITEELCANATGTYTGPMLIPYFGTGTDPDTGELHESGNFFDLGMKLSYDIRLNGASLRIFGGIKNMFDSYQTDFDTGVNRDPSYIYGPISSRTIYFGINLGNRLD